ADVLRRGFASGRLPSEADLMLAYGASRTAVRDVLARLRGAGIIERLQGVGTLVVSHRPGTPLPEAHGVEPLRSGVFSGRLHVEELDRQLIPMPPPVAYRLGEAPGAPCLRVDYVGYCDGEPQSVATNYVRGPEHEAVSRTPFTTDWYTMLEQAGLDVAATEFMIEAALADDLTGDLLGVRPGAPVLLLEQVIRDASGRPYDYAVVHCRGDRIALLSHATRPSLGVSPGS
ncbi:MAG: GntR family transcriptional regulator, partial [Streptomycetaceae bacterium]|nr:GntR family transcriptional regulator [Streptomycetaceae bacterium]